MEKVKKVIADCRQYREYLKSTGMPEIDNSTDTNNEYKIKRIAFYIGCEDNRSDRYRAFNIINELRNRGIAVDIYRAYCINQLLKDINYDLLVIFREDRYRMLRLNEILNHVHSCGIPIIYDTDDYTIEDDSSRGAQHVLSIIEHVDAITVTTEFLAKLFRSRTGKDVYVVKNTINAEQIYLARKLIRTKPVNENVKIVYQSGTATHNRDFMQVEEALLTILQRFNYVELHIFGPLELSKWFAPYMSRIYFHPYTDYRLLEVYVSDMDINIAPLEINDFNNSKSELKIFESALLKIPTVASPTEPYSTLIKNEVNGFLAATTKDWIDDLSLLIVDRKYREEMGQTAEWDFVPMFDISHEIDNVIAIYERVCEQYVKC